MATDIYKNIYKPLLNGEKDAAAQAALDAVKKKVLAIIFKIMYNKGRK